MKYNLEISIHGYEYDDILVYAEDLEISDIIEIIKQYPLDSLNRFDSYYKIIIKRWKGEYNNGNSKQ